MRFKKIGGAILYEGDSNRLSCGVYLDERGKYQHAIPFKFQSGDNPVGLVGPLRDRPYFMVFSKKVEKGEEKLEEILDEANRENLTIDNVRDRVESGIPGAMTFDECGEEYYRATFDKEEFLRDYHSLQRLRTRETN